MLSGTGPISSMPSACRGDAAYDTPKRPRSHASVFRTFVSASHAPQPPALTTRSENTRPYSPDASGFSAAGAAFGSPFAPLTTSPSREDEARR